MTASILYFSKLRVTKIVKFSGNTGVYTELNRTVSHRITTCCKISIKLDNTITIFYKMSMVSIGASDLTLSLLLFHLY